MLPLALMQDPSLLPGHLEHQSTLLTLARYRIENYQPAERGGCHDDGLVSRSLEAFLEFLPEEGKAHLANDINKAVDDRELYDVFLNLYTGLRNLVLARPRPSTFTPSPNADTLTQTGNYEKRFSDALLKRDHYCCVATGDMNLNHWKSIGSPEEIINLTPTDGAHIIPFSYSRRDNNEEDVSPEISRSWEVLYRCFPDLRTKLNFTYDHINDLSNGVTLSRWAHESFGRFHIAFKPTDNENVYEVETFPGLGKWYKEHLYQQVTFHNFGSESRALPSRILLDCPWRLAKVLNASRMASAFQFDYQKWEEIKENAGHLLNSDGSADIGQILSACPFLPRI